MKYQYLSAAFVLLSCSGETAENGANTGAPFTLYAGFEINQIVATNDGGYDILYTFQNPVGQDMCFKIIKGKSIQDDQALGVFHADGRRVVSRLPMENTLVIDRGQTRPGTELTRIAAGEKWQKTVHILIDLDRFDADSGEGLYFEIRLATNGNYLGNQLPCAGASLVEIPASFSKPVKRGPLVFPSK